MADTQMERWQKKIPSMYPDMTGT
ncbi:hypothetical protein CK1_39110 [Ruminococcus sp. SR1/5]|nr:hypothetical protein CK1_39110 [Ruminococcus sp. SR1/5]